MAERLDIRIYIHPAPPSQDMLAQRFEGNNHALITIFSLGNLSKPRCVQLLHMQSYFLMPAPEPSGEACSDGTYGRDVPHDDRSH